VPLVPLVPLVMHPVPLAAAALQVLLDAALQVPH
jgi:hypothetical protein